MTDVANTAKAILVAALDLCARQMEIDGREAIAGHLRQDGSDAHAIFFSCVGKLVAEWLGTWDADTRAVYFYNYDIAMMNVRPDAANQAPVCLVVWTRRKTAALRSLVTALDRALVQGYTDLIGAHPWTHLLDAQMIDDADVKNGTGGSALLFSLYLASTQVWKRECGDVLAPDKVVPTLQLSTETKH